MLTERDIQSYIDATVEGWELVVYIGSNFVGRWNYDTVERAAEELVALVRIVQRGELKGYQ